MQFVEGVLAEDGIIELGTTFDDVKREAADFAFGLALLSRVPERFGPPE